jgi:hypothetical protein
MNEEVPLDAAVPEVAAAEPTEPEDVVTEPENVAAAEPTEPEDVVTEPENVAAVKEAEPSTVEDPVPPTSTDTGTSAPAPAETEVDDLAMAVNEAAQEIVEAEPTANVKEDPTLKKETKKRVRRVGKTTPNKMLKVEGAGPPMLMVPVPVPVVAPPPTYNPVPFVTTMYMEPPTDATGTPLVLEQQPAPVVATNTMTHVAVANPAYVPRVMSKHDEKWNR